MHYILDEQGNPVLEPDLIKWARWFEKAERQLGDTHFGDIHVSTVFLGALHVDNSLDNDDSTPTMLYETMVFADEATVKRLLELSEYDDRSIFSKVFGYSDIQKRYATKAEALEGHRNMCTFIEVCLTKGLLASKPAQEGA